MDEEEDMREEIKRFETKADANAWREDKSESDSDSFSKKYFCPDTGAHFNFTEACHNLHDLRMIKPSERRANYEFESDTEGTIIIKELLDTSVQPFSPGYSEVE